ncbi:MAG: chromate transporter, partial [Clostridia bacterium]|nr:chromate transporter [Clostridia bacterium]
VFGGVLGATIATIGVVLPSLVIIVVVTKILNKFMQNKWVKGALNGIRPVVVALILSAVVSVVLEVVLPNFSVKQTVAKLFQTIGLPSDQFQQQWQGFAEQSFGDFNWVSLLLVCVISPFAFVKIGNKKINPVFLILASGVLGLLVFGVFGVQQ